LWRRSKSYYVEKRVKIAGKAGAETSLTISNTVASNQSEKEFLWGIKSLLAPDNAIVA
jgi:hypothetical protein